MTVKSLQSLSLQSLPLAKIIELGTITSMIIGGFIWLETRYDPVNSSELALLEAKIYMHQLEIRSLDSTINMYNGKEDAGVLTDTEWSRRETLISQRMENIYEIQNLNTAKLAIRQKE